MKHPQDFIAADRLLAGAKLGLLGVLVCSAGILSYPIALVWVGVVSQTSKLELEPIALVSLVLTVLGLISSGVGLSVAMNADAVRTKVQGRLPSSPIRVLCYVNSERKYRRLGVTVAIAYGVIYAIISGMLVDQPGLKFSVAYHMQIPSASFTLCCGPVGQVPGALIVLTDHLGLVITPANLALLFIVSWLVGLNFSTAMFTRKFWKGQAEGGWLTSVGASVGLFTACPTCAGFLFSTLVGTTGAISFAVLLASLQPLFILVSIPLLAVTLAETGRRLSHVRDSCAVPRE